MSTTWRSTSGAGLDPQSQSVNRTSFSAIQDFERLNDHAFALHLSRPICSLPEQLYAFTCPILHRRFEMEGADWPKNPVGTGPFELTRYEVGRAATFRRRPIYWGAMPKVEEIDYIDLGPDVATHVAALAAGQVDILYRVTISELDLVRRLPHVRLLKTQAAHTLVMRMQPNQKPYDDIRVRQAVLSAADNARMLKYAYRGHGLVAENTHVAPSQPDYAALPVQPRDVAKARRLLTEAGYQQWGRPHADAGQHPGALGAGHRPDSAAGLRRGGHPDEAECRSPGGILVGVGQDTLRPDLLVAPAARGYGLRSGLPHRQRLERKRLFQRRLRPGPGYRHGHPGPQGPVRGDGQGRNNIARSCRDCSALLAGKFTAVSDRVIGHRVHPSDYSGWIGWAWRDGAAAISPGIGLRRAAVPGRRLAGAAATMLTVSILVFLLLEVNVGGVAVKVLDNSRPPTNATRGC